MNEGKERQSTEPAKEMKKIEILEKFDYSDPKAINIKKELFP